MDLGIIVGIALTVAFAGLTAGRIIWEKRTRQPEFEEQGGAVGGWFGGVPDRR